MADLISPTIKLVVGCVNMYTDFCTFKEECTLFRESLSNAEEVLEDFQQQLSKWNVTRTHTKLRRPMELLQGASKEGGEVLRKCSGRKLLAFVFSRQLMGMLRKARRKFEEAMRLLLVLSVRVQVSTRQLMEGVGERLEKLHDQINSSVASEHEVADLIHKMQEHNSQQQGGAITIAQELSEVLAKMGVVSSEQDCGEQFDDLQSEAESLRTAMVIYDEDLLEVIKALSLATHPPPAPTSSPPLAKTASTADRDRLVCLISGEIMQDPVAVDGSGITYDRKSLCMSLLFYPDLEPVTGERFDRPLLYAPSIALRNLLMVHYGDASYKTVKTRSTTFCTMTGGSSSRLAHQQRSSTTRAVASLFSTPGAPLPNPRLQLRSTAAAAGAEAPSPPMISNRSMAATESICSKLRCRPTWSEMPSSLTRKTRLSILR
jgi:hypothetical protein